MVREIIFACQAEEEIAEAYFWYEEREPGLGDRFFQALKRSVKAVALQPEIHPLRFDQVRRALVQKFPYAIYFEHDEEFIYVHSVHHQSRNPTGLEWLSDF